MEVLGPSALFPGEDGFNMDDPLTPLESYLLQRTIPEGALLQPGLVTNNEDFPGHVFDHFPTPLPDAAEDKEVIVFESPPKKESLSTPACSQATLSATLAPPVPPQISVPPPPELASLLTLVFDPFSAPPSRATPLDVLLGILWISLTFLVLPCVPFVGNPIPFYNVIQHLPCLPFWDKEPAAPMTLPPSLPEEEQLSTIVEELPHPGDFMDVDVLPSPPRVYHLVTGTLLHSCSLVVCSSSPEASPSNHGNEIQQCKKRKKKKAKGKGKAVVLSPVLSPPPVTTPSAHEEPPSLPKKVLKRKHTPSKTAPSEPGPSKLTHARVATPTAAVIPSNAEASNAVHPTVKKPCFSPKKASKKKSSHKTTKSAVSDAPPDSNQMFLGRPKQQYLAAELTQAQDPDQEVTAPNKFFDPVCYSHKNGTYGAHSSCYAYYTRASDHYEKTCFPCMHRQANCTWNNWFPGADCDQCQEGHHGGCSARYTACEMHEITSCLTTFAQYNIPALCCNIMQLHGINCELEHIDYLYCGRLCAHDHVVHNIAESLGQFTSAKDGNELIEDLSHAYHEVCSFIVDDGLQHSLSLSLDLPEGSEYVPSDNNTSMWDEGEDELATGSSGVQGDDEEGKAGASK
ncbi:hypothetical protein ARMGADRAFT_1085228 [Armillaria gallica]|uniref:Uncharacterized protein n=1 Tax=Armillaria gallica TaxID=47427 RepID=A0A2H3DI11_ARMGA|nr:hypothetical protein ARMGADRAFT_1085228 [Armillaria gallica]